MTIWVRILNLPFEWMNNKKGLKIARLIDKNCLVDVDEFGVASGTFLRARVAIPFDQPLRRWVTIRRDGRDESFNLQYEKLPFYCYSCGLIGHGELECKSPADRDSHGKLPFDRGLRAPEERRRRLQSFEQAADSASWNSGSRKSRPGSATRRTSGDGDALKPGEQVVNSPPGKGNNGKDKSKVSEIARQLFPDASVLGQLPKKRKPGETRDGVVGAAAEGKLIEQIDMDLSLAVIPVGRPREAGGVPNAAGFDTGQGNEKKPRSGNGLNNLQSSKEVNSNAGLPIQPCNNQ
jgi:hypothetical protein